DIDKRTDDRVRVDEAAVHAGFGEPSRQLPGPTTDANVPEGGRLEVLLVDVDGERVLELDVPQRVGVPPNGRHWLDAGSGQLAGVEGKAEPGGVRPAAQHLPGVIRGARP